MTHSPAATALQSLTEWWRDMGVEVDSSVPIAAKTMASTATETALGTAQSAPRRAASKSERRTVDDWIAVALERSAQSVDLPALKAAVEAFDGCPLKAGANKTVVYDGIPDAPVMVIGEGAGGQEDQVGLPFVGKAGQLLDKMLAAINLSRKTNTFITNVTFWRPPGNRNPEPDELAVCRPFVDRMIDLVSPQLIILAGGVSAKSMLETKTGIMRLRGTLHEYQTPAGRHVPMVPMFHPAYLLRRPQDKSRAWRDLLTIQSLVSEHVS